MSTPKQGSPPAKPTEPTSSVDRMFLAKALLLVCALQFFALSYFIYDKKKNRPAQPPNDTVPGVVTKADSANTDNHFKGNGGPWGELEYVRINIVSPEDYLPEQLKNMPPTQWHFAGYDSEKLASLIRSCDLHTEQQAELLNPQNWTVTGNDIIVTPTKELVLGLSAAARSQLYSVLAQNPANRSQQWPYTFRQNGFEEWFLNSEVSLPNQALIKKLTYQRGNAMCFSDLRELLMQVPDETEHRAITKALSRRTGLLVKLRVRPDSDLEALTKYWSLGGRAKDVGALFESLTKVSGGTTIDISHLLPGFARMRLNTFPKPPASPEEIQPDCYWTAMNFFKTPPDAPYVNDAVWRQELAENYTQVEHPTFGDLLFLVQPDGVPQHAAVFIADDVVFTKNGGNQRQPWLLMKVEDMLARYPSSQPLTLVVFKPKNRRD